MTNMERKICLQPINITHFKKLSTLHGFLEFCRGNSPDYTSTYNVDDNSRAALSAAKLYMQTKDKLYIKLLTRHINFLYGHMMKPAPLKHGYILHKGLTKEKISPDALGRLLFASSWILSEDTFSDFREKVYPLFLLSLSHYFNFANLRPVAYSLCGLCKLYSAAPSRPLHDALQKGSRRLLTAYERTRKKDWAWFENALTYENARLPQSLFEVYNVTGDKKILDGAQATLNFLRRLTLYDGMFVPVGNQGWYRYKKERAVYDQQPVEAGSMCECLVSAYKATKNKTYLKEARLCFEWYGGRNTNGVLMISPDDGGVYDGLGRAGANKNQGAEAMLSYLLARAEIAKAAYA